MKLFRKIAAGVCAAAAAVSLCGCNMRLPFTGNPLDFNKSYTVNADIGSDRLSAKASITRVGVNDWQFSFTEPKELNGVVMTFTDKGYSAKLGELSFKADKNAAYTILPEVIGETLDLLAGLTSESFSQKDGVVTAEVSVNDKTVTVTADEKGNLISMKSPYHQLSVSFSGQQPYKPQQSAEEPVTSDPAA